MPKGAIQSKSFALTRKGLVMIPTLVLCDMHGAGFEGVQGAVIVRRGLCPEDNCTAQEE